MTRKNSYKVDEVLRSLAKKHDVLIVNYDIYVLGPYSKIAIRDLGNKSFGKIDFLVNYCGFCKFLVNEFPEL